MFTEIGPVIVGEGGKLTPRNHTWNKKFGLLIVDNPAGVGFSVLGEPARPVKTEEQVPRRRHRHHAAGRARTLPPACSIRAATRSPQVGRELDELLRQVTLVFP